MQAPYTSNGLHSLEVGTKEFVKMNQKLFPVMPVVSLSAFRKSLKSNQTAIPLAIDQFGLKPDPMINENCQMINGKWFRCPSPPRCSA
jgi:hypothetical protein